MTHEEWIAARREQLLDAREAFFTEATSGDWDQLGRTFCREVYHSLTRALADLDMLRNHCQQPYIWSPPE